MAEAEAPIYKSAATSLSAKRLKVNSPFTINIIIMSVAGRFGHQSVMPLARSGRQNMSRIGSIFAAGIEGGQYGFASEEERRIIGNLCIGQTCLPA